MPKRILTLDDDPRAVATLRAGLDAIPRFEYALRHVATREELAATPLAGFHVAFLDDRFDGADASDLLGTLRDAGFVRPIVILSDQRDPELAVRLIQAGADDYLAKATADPRRLARAMSDADCRYLHRKMEGDLEEKAIELSTTLARESQALRELERSKERAEAANRSKSTFLANMSHEIRTPLTAILGYADELRSEQLDEAERRDAIEIIHQNGEFLLRIVSDILDLSKIEAGKLEIERIPVPPLQVVADTCQLLEPRARAKGIELRHGAHGPIPESVFSDPTRLRQILVNLVSNAVKFTETGSVSVETRLLPPGEGAGPRTLRDGVPPIAADERRLEITVTDTGIGVTKEQITRVFEAFSQGDPSTTRQHGGTGLGLTISDRLARMLGGCIRVQSTPGVGSTFRLTVACGPLNGVAMIDAATAADRSAHARPAGPEARRDLRLPPCHILLAEDNAMNRQLIRVIVERFGATVVEATDGAQACALVREEERAGRPIDLVLMDLQMPELDGFGATRRLRASGFSAPIVALTGNALESERHQCLETGFDDFTSKPVRKEKLFDILSARLGSSAPVERNPS